MGWVTVIGPASAQVEYRLQASAGCSLHHEGHDLAQDHDTQVDYRLGDGQDEAQALVWIGEGLRDVGIEPGTVMQDETDKARARALMSGRNPATMRDDDPATAEVLVAPKLVVDPRGKLPAAPLVDAVTAVVNGSGRDAGELLGEWSAKRLGRAERGVKREGEVHRIAFKDAVRLADEAGVDLSALYSGKTLAEAKKYAGTKTRVGIRGFDAVVDLPKSVSGLWAIAPAELATAILETHRDAVVESFAHYEQWTSYTMRGHHGDGGSAEKVTSSGLLGWMMPHQVARPVGGAAPDPHVHTHVVIAHLAHSEDGQWRTIGAGGRDVHRMVHAFDSFAKARFRALTAERFGLRWEQDERTRQWEVVGIPRELREQLSKRGVQVARELEKLGIHDPKDATRMQAKVASATSRERKAGGPGPGGELRAEWRRQAEATASADREATGPDGRIRIDKVVGRSAPGWGPDGPVPGHPGPTPPMPPLPQLAASAVAELTEHRKEFRRADLLAAVLDRLPQIDTMEHAEHLVDRVLGQHGLVAALPEQGQTHLTHHARYTSCAIVDAERVIVESAASRYGQGAAIVPADAAAMATGTFEASAGFTLSAEQRATVDRLLTGGHGIDAVIGVAGSGKTTLMSAARTGWQAHGLVVAGASTAAVAAVNLEAEAGIPSATLASWLMRIRTGQGLAGVDVLVLDEAAMCDDRQVAELVTAAAATGTKLVLIGDPMQLRSPGVGGSFRHIHRIVDGAVLTENRRQSDQAERAALATWRTGDHRGALLQWSEAGRVHVAEDGPSALAAMLTRWDETRQQVEDPFARIAHTLLLAGTNADVDKLNAGARAIRIAAGELEHGREFRRAGGGRIEISVGDVVMTRANDYRQRRTKGAEMDVLNGYRGIVTAVDERGITVCWRSGEESRLGTRYIAEGGVCHGYALTVAKAQGLTAQDAIVYGAGLDPNTLYPAMSRDRGRVDLVLPRTLIESEDTRIRLGEPASEAEALRRAINAYADALKVREEPMVSIQLGHALPVVPQAEAARAARGESDQEQQPVAEKRAARRAEAARSTSTTGRPARPRRQRENRAEARAARPTAPGRLVPATAEQVRARAAEDVGRGGEAPTMYRVPWGTTPDQELNERRERASGELATRQGIIDNAQAVIERAEEGRPGHAEAKLLAERAVHQDQAARVRAVQQAEADVETAEKAVAEAKAAHKKLVDARENSNLRTALRGPTAWRKRDEEIIAADAAARTAADNLTEAKTRRTEARAAEPTGSAVPGWHRYGREAFLEEAAKFEQRFPAELAQARRQDQATLAAAREALAEALAEAEQWSRRLTVLRAEQARRAALDPAELAIEDGLRGLRTVDARILDAARDALAAADQAPPFTPWNAREFGALDPAGLAEREQELREQVDAFEAEIAARRERMREGQAEVEAGRGTAMNQLRENRTVAYQHAQRDIAAEPIRELRDAAQATIDETSKKIKTMREELAEHGRVWWLANHGMTPNTARAQIKDELTPSVDQAIGERDAANAALAALPGGDPGPSGQGRNRYARFEERLPEAVQAAMGRDRERLAAEHQHIGQEISEFEGGAAAVRADLDDLAAERDLRRELPTPIARAEQIARTTHGAELRADERAEALARQQYREELAAWREQYPEAARQEQQRHHSHTYDSPSPSRDLGRGISM